MCKLKSKFNKASVLILLWLSSVVQHVFSQDFTEGITYVADNFAPYNYLDDNGIAAGMNVEILEAMFKLLGSDNVREDIKILFFYQGYKLVQDSDKKTMLLTVARTQTREKLFNWIGPIGVSNATVMILNDNPLHVMVNKADDLKQYTYGVVQDDVSGAMLQEVGVAKDQIQNFNVVDELIINLAQSKVAAIVNNQDVIAWYVNKYNKVNKDNIHIKSIYSQELGRYYFASSKAISADIVFAHQRALDRIKSDLKFMQALENKYFGSLRAAPN